MLSIITYLDDVIRDIYLIKRLIFAYDANFVGAFDRVFKVGLIKCKINKTIIQLCFSLMLLPH